VILFVRKILYCEMTEVGQNRDYTANSVMLKREERDV
jgi:hypothetical protein